jgi:hypothetical protein
MTLFPGISRPLYRCANHAFISLSQAAYESRQLLQEGELHMKEKMSIQLSLQKHREMAELAEVATHERIRQLQMRRVREDVSGCALFWLCFHPGCCCSVVLAL